MMTRLRTAILTLALLTTPSLAYAQRGAPIVDGATTTDLATTVRQLQSKNADLTLEVSELKAANARITGRLESLEFELRRSQQAQDALQKEDEAVAATLTQMGEMIAAMEAELVVLRRQVRANSGFVELEPSENLNAVSDPEATEAAAAPAPTIAEQAAARNIELPEDAEALFQQAMGQLQNFSYGDAEVSFRAFLDQYGEAPRAAEAQYWLGEVLYQQESHVESGAAYTEMIRTYPDDPRAPEALVKLARSMRLVGETDGACQALAALPQRYPSASSVTNNLARLERSRAGCES